jgi:hypothetical protein
MGRSISYYGVKMVGHEYLSPLVKDMAETWGDDLGDMNQRTTVFLIGLFAAKIAESDEGEISPLVQEVISRIDEISVNDAIALIQALAN